MDARQGYTLYTLLNSHMSTLSLINIGSASIGYDNANAFAIDFNLVNGNIAKLVIENTGIRYLFYNGSDWLTIWTIDK